MKCNVCKAVELIGCDHCGDVFRSIIFCFSDDNGNHHFCSEMCFNLWIVDKHKSRLRRSHA